MFYTHMYCILCCAFYDIAIVNIIDIILNCHRYVHVSTWHVCVRLNSFPYIYGLIVVNILEQQQKSEF